MSSSVARIAAIVPCHNEAESITAVVNDLRSAVPGTDIYGLIDGDALPVPGQTGF